MTRIYGNIERASVDFRSCKSGDWRNPDNWQYFDVTWKGATFGNFPQSTNNTFIQVGHTMTLLEDENCKDLNVNVTADVVRLDCKTFTLTLNDGKLRAFSGLINVIPGSDSTSSGISGWITGKLKFLATVSGADFIAAGQWGTSVNNDKIELSLSGVTGDSNLRPAIRFKSLEVLAGDWKEFGGLQLLDDIIIKGGKFTITSVANEYKNFNVNSGAVLNILSATNDLASLSHFREGTLRVQGVGTDLPVNPGSLPWSDFNNLLLADLATADVVVNFLLRKQLEIDSRGVFVFNGFSITFDADAGLLFSGTVAVNSLLTNWPIDIPFSKLAKFLTVDNDVTMADEARLIEDSVLIKSGASLNVAVDTVANRIDTDSEYLILTDDVAAGGIDNVDFLSHQGGFLLALI